MSDDVKTLHIPLGVWSNGPYDKMNERVVLMMIVGESVRFRRVEPVLIYQRRSTCVSHTIRLWLSSFGQRLSTKRNFNW